MYLQRRDFPLKLLAIAAKSVMLFPIYALFAAVYQQLPPDRVGLLWGFLLGLLSASVGYILRCSKEQEKPSRKVWFVAAGFLSGALALGGVVLAFLNSTQSVTGVLCLASVGSFFFWGWRAPDLHTIDVLSPAYGILTIALHLIAMIVVGIMAFFSKIEIPMDFTFLAAVTVVAGLLTLYVYNQGHCDFVAESLQSASSQQIRAVRRYNRRLALTLVAGSGVLFAVFGYLTFRLTTWLLGTVGDGVFVLFSGWVQGRRANNRVNAESSESMLPIRVDLMEGQVEEAVEEPLLNALIIGIVFLLLVGLLYHPLKMLANYCVDTFRARGSRENEEQNWTYYRDSTEWLPRTTKKTIKERTVSLRAAVRDYLRMEDPAMQVRGALPLLRRMASERQKVSFPEGDTAREQVVRTGYADAAFAEPLERMLYADQTPNQEEGTRARTLVQSVYQSKPDSEQVS